MSVLFFIKAIMKDYSGTFVDQPRQARTRSTNHTC